MENTRENWDAAAGDFQAVFRLGLNEYNAMLLRFWQEEGMLFPKARVIDIGCGVGKYGTYLAELGYDVTLTDISEKMLEHARENMAKFRTPWTVYCCDFHKATGREPVFAGGFDLAISTMSPAVCDVVTVRKMSGMTRGWCFLACFYDCEQPLRDALIRELGLDKRQISRDWKENCASLLQAVTEAGCTPCARVVDYNWEDRRTPEQMRETMLRRFFSEEKRDAVSGELLRLIRAHAGEDGTVLDAVNAKVKWIWWKPENRV